jgi:aminopeptidase N
LLNFIFFTDLIAVPDFPYEAQETWGLVMLRETSVLYSSLQDPPITKQNIALEIAQEIAHMWFGNLVTCKTW